MTKNNTYDKYQKEAYELLWGSARWYERQFCDREEDISCKAVRLVDDKNNEAARS